VRVRKPGKAVPPKKLDPKKARGPDDFDDAIPY
jgi:hypothetical protein